MDLTKAIELFEELKRRIDEQGDYLRESEYRTRILLIDPLLRMLGWNVEDFYCVEIEYRTSQFVKERADYVLKNGESKVAIVEAKKLGTDMKSGERRQAKEYADYADTSQCVLTDGAKWMLYDLNQGRNPDTMQPQVEFDIKNEVPEQLILRCLALWRPRFTPEQVEFDIKNEVPEQLILRCLALWRPRFIPEVGSSPASNLPFDSGVDNSQSDTNGATNEPPQQPLPDGPPKDSDECYSFASKRRYPPYTTPTRLKIGDRVEKQVNFWRDVIHEVVVWLVDEGMLSVSDCPILIGKWTFIGREGAVKTVMALRSKIRKNYRTASFFSAAIQRPTNNGID